MVLSVALSNLTLHAANLSSMLLQASHGRAPISGIRFLDGV